MLYLLDANCLIDAKNMYYPFDRVPEFWDWLIDQGQEGLIKIPAEIYSEFRDTKKKSGEKDELAEWATKTETKEALLFEEEPDSDLLARVTYGGYMPDPTDEDLQKIGNDPFLIAYALKDKQNRCVVSTEVSSPKKMGANKRVPDVCHLLGISCVNTFYLIRVLNFSTSFKSK